MAMIENEILASVYSEEMYNEVKFLEAKDFSKAENRALWVLIQQCDGDTIEMIKRMSRLQRVSWTNAVQAACLGVANYKVAQMGCKLVELRFERVLITLLDDLIVKAQSKIEIAMLQEIKSVVGKNNIFELAEGSAEYVKQHASTYTIQRLKDFREYVDKRFNTIKNIQHGNK